MQSNVQLITVIPQFDPQSSRYRCWCCGCCRVTTCVKVIGALELIGVIFHLITAIITYVRASAYSSTDLIIAIIDFLVSATIIGLMLYGVAKQRAAFLIPHLILQILALILLVVGAVLYGIIAARVSDPRMSTSAEQTIGTALYSVVAAMCVAFLLEVLFLVNVWRCYRYLKEKVVFERMMATAPPPPVAMVPHYGGGGSPPSAPMMMMDPSPPYPGDGSEYKGGPV